MTRDTTDIEDFRNLVEELTVACVLLSTTYARPSDEVLKLCERVDRAIDAVFAERDQARGMCNVIRREFGAGLDDKKPFILPWEEK